MGFQSATFESVLLNAWCNHWQGLCHLLDAIVAEFDLVTIGEGAAVEYATVRAFGVDNGAMILGSVVVGNHASVGYYSVVAPYTAVAANSHLGPHASSYETGAALDAKHVRINRAAMPALSVWAELLVATPITFLVDFLSHIPGFLVLYWMIRFKCEHETILVLTA